MYTDLIAAIRLIEKDYEKIDTSKHAGIYLFTNENIIKMINELSLKSKKVLTVCSSGDHAFNFLLENVDSIELFDINILAEYIFYLKKAAIESLSYDEFLDFFFPKPLNKYSVFSKECYKKIRNSIEDKRIKLFWDYLISNYDLKKLYTSGFFAERPPSRKTAITLNKYLNNETNYNLLKEKLKEIPKFKFYNINIFNDRIPLNNEIDFLYLSNILNNIHASDEEDYLKKLKQLIIELSRTLTRNGQIGVCYLYCYLDNYWYNLKNNIQSLITKKESENNFIKNKCDLIEFSGSLNINSRRTKDIDALILYKKS